MSFFPSTHWSEILRVNGSSETQSREALTSLCQTYWYPLYAFARLDVPQADAEDLTQGFFEHLLQKRIIGKADPDLGRFRSFLLASFKNFRLSQRQYDRAQKRGGGVVPISFDELKAEERFAHEPVDRLTPDLIYERNWALQVLERARSLLHQEYTSTGKENLFLLLQPSLQGRDDTAQYSEIARATNKSTAAVKMEVSRMRCKYRERLLAVVAETVADPAEAKDELRHLLQILQT